MFPAKPLVRPLLSLTCRYFARSSAWTSFTSILMPGPSVVDTAMERMYCPLAVAGFTMADLSVAIEDNQLVIRGKQAEETGKVYLHRGIAARQFQRIFVLADGLEVLGAQLASGLLHIDLERAPAASRVKKIEIRDVVS
mgnify:CR=1 FL=1